jgi:hypothetical protein
MEVTNNETQFYQWVFEHCNWRLSHTQESKSEVPFASKEVFTVWYLKKLGIKRNG